MGFGGCHHAHARVVHLVPAEVDALEPCVHAQHEPEVRGVLLLQREEGRARHVQAPQRGVADVEHLIGCPRCWYYFSAAFVLRACATLVAPIVFSRVLRGKSTIDTRNVAREDSGRPTSRVHALCSPAQPFHFG